VTVGAIAWPRARTRNVIAVGVRPALDTP
jgi:hypothetical protein